MRSTNGKSDARSSNVRNMCCLVGEPCSWEVLGASPGPPCPAPTLARPTIRTHAARRGDRYVTARYEHCASWLCPRRDLLVRRELRVSDSAQATVASLRLAAPRGIDPTGLPRGALVSSPIPRRPNPNSRHPRAVSAGQLPSRRPRAPAGVIWVPHASSHRIVDRAGPGSTWPQWRGRRRAPGVP